MSNAVAPVDTVEWLEESSSSIAIRFWLDLRMADGRDKVFMTRMMLVAITEKL